MIIPALFLLHFDNNFVLELAQQFWPLAYSIVAVIGLMQGFIIGQAIVERFPRLQYHTRLALTLLSILFLTYAIVSVARFADPDKVNPSQLFGSAAADELVTMVLQVIGLNMDTAAIIGFSVSLFMLLILKLTKLEGYGKYFVLIVGIVTLLIMGILKFSDYQPSSFEIFLFVLYHASMTAGLLWGTRKRLYSKELRIRNFVTFWTGKTEL